MKVGPRVWTLEEFQKYLALHLKAQPREPSPDFQLIKKELLNELLLISLVEIWAKEKNIQSKELSLTPEEKMIFSKEKFLLQALKHQKNHLSLYQLLLKELLKEIPKPSLKEQKAFYAQNKRLFDEPEKCYLKQIVVEQEKLAQSLQRRLIQGEDFDTLNQLYSLKPNPEWIKKGRLDIFDRACFDSKIKKHSILKSPYGYHIFFVEKTQPRQKKSFALVQNQIIQKLKEKKLPDQFQIWLKKELFKQPVWTNKKLLDKIHIQYKTNYGLYSFFPSFFPTG